MNRDLQITEAAQRTVDNLTRVPLISGGCQIEMHAGGVDLELEINADGDVVSVFFARADVNEAR